MYTTQQNAEPSGSTMLHVPPPYAVLVPATPETVNSSAFPSRQPTACLARTQSCDQGVQFDIHGDAIIGQMKPIPVSAPQAPPTAPKEGDGKQLFRLWPHCSFSSTVYLLYFLCRFNSKKDFCICKSQAPSRLLLSQVPPSHSIS